MSRRDAVTPEVAAYVLQRDTEMVLKATESRSLLPAVLHPDSTISVGHFETDVCPAWVIDPSEFGNCWGRWRLEHVHDEHGVGKRRAPSDPDHLMALCQGHTEDGMSAGRIWATSHRPQERSYLLDRRREREASS